MGLKPKHIGRESRVITFKRWRIRLMIVGMCLFLVVMNVGLEGQTSSSAPPAPAETAQPAQSPSAAPASQSEGTAGIPQAEPNDQPAADDQSGVFVFKKEVQEVVLHATVVDDQ